MTLEDRVAQDMEPGVSLAMLVLKYASVDVDDTLLDAAQAVVLRALATEAKEEAAPASPPPTNPSTLGWTCYKCGLWVPYNGFHQFSSGTIPSYYYCSVCCTWYSAPHTCQYSWQPLKITYGMGGNPGGPTIPATACTNDGGLGTVQVTSCFGCH